MAGAGRSKALNSGSLSPSKTSQACPSYTAEQWLERRDLIRQLYVEEDLTLKQVRTILEEDHRFPATERQFKRKIKEWKLDKNIKDEEMRIILEYEKMRSNLYGRDSIFYVRGRLVDHKKLQRFVQRKGVPQLSLFPDNRLVSLPEDITCHTPIDEAPPSFTKFDDQGTTTIINGESDPEKPEDYSMVASRASAEGSQQAGAIEVDHASLNNFWQSYWPDHDPGKDILEFKFLNLPIQLPHAGAAHGPGGLKSRFQSPNAQDLIDVSREATAHKRRKIDSMDTYTITPQHPEPRIPFNIQTRRATTGANAPSAKDVTTDTVGETDLEAVLSEIRAIRGQQATITSLMSSLHQQHRELDERASNFNSSHTRHEKSIDAILAFLASVYSKRLQGDALDMNAMLSDLPTR